MLHVEIKVPALDKKYEFSLNENVTVKNVIEEVAAVIGQHEQKSWSQGEAPLVLCSCSGLGILPEGKTLYECQIQPGSQLMLI